MSTPSTALKLRGAPATRGLEALGRRLVIGLVFTYVGVLVGAPLVALVNGAFSSGLGAVVRALSVPAVARAFWLTLQIAVITVVVHAVCGTALAWVLVRGSERLPGRRVINAIIDLPFAVSAVVAGYMLLLLFGRNGALAPAIQALGVQVAFAVPGMVIATLFVTLPFMVREIMPVLAAFGVEHEQAAATLGASSWQTFWRVTFPALRWGFLYGVTLTFARALGEFGAVLVIGGGVQGRTETATLYIYRALEERQYVGAYSAALVLGLLSLMLVWSIDLLRRAREKDRV
jgi:sulfate/thiosulfate transport system permease protein